MNKYKWMLKLALTGGLVLLTLWLCGAGAAQAAPPGPGTPVVYWVNDPGDAPDASPGDGICDVTLGATPLPSRTPSTVPGNAEPCTLRAAIEEANLDGVPSVIAFEICSNDAPWSGSGGSMATASSEATITPGNPPLNNGPLPALTEGNTYVNGYTQGWPSLIAGYDDPVINGIVGCGASLMAAPNITPFGRPLNTQLAVAVDGSFCVPPPPLPGNITPVPGGGVPSGSILPWGPLGGACSGFTVNSSRNVIAGLNIRSWANAGILIMPLFEAVEPPYENVVWGNFIGTDLRGATTESPSGAVSTGNRFGVEIIGGAFMNYVGDTWHIPAWLVPDGSWTEELTNNERNLISGNDNPLAVYGATCRQGPVVFLPFHDDGAGVFIGVDPCIRATWSGDEDFNLSPLLTMGGLDNHVRNNYIGASAVVTFPLANSNGVWLNYDAASNHIGGCVVFPFRVGLDRAECDPQHDVDLQQDPNLISGNQRNLGANQSQVGGHGIWLNGAPEIATLTDGVPDVDYNEIGGNFIGVDGLGVMALPNHGDGVFLVSGFSSEVPFPFAAPDHNEIGATTEYMDGMLEPGAYTYGNLISGNGDAADVVPFPPYGDFDNGVELLWPGVDDNRIGYGNLIGVDSAGAGALGNGDNGVLLGVEVANNYVHNNAGLTISKPFVPTDAQSQAGAISANGVFPLARGRSGVKIEDAFRNAAFRNCIGGDALSCDAILGNVESGVFITGVAPGNMVGLNPTAGMTDTAINEENWIHHNGLGANSAGDGVTVVGDNSDQNTIRFNRIYSNTDLGIDLGQDGVDTSWGAGPNDKLKWPDPISNAAFWNVQFTACAGCMVDFYAMYLDESDAPSNGEGRYWLMAAKASGGVDTVNVSVPISNTFSGAPAKNVCVTLTSTDAAGNTSEFSNCTNNSDFYPNVITLNTVGVRSRAWIVWAGIMPLGVWVVWRFVRRRRQTL